MRVTIAFLLVLIGASLPRPAGAAESFDNCSGFITSLPAVITTQGVWCMDRDLSSALSSGSLVTIATNNVTIDCNDFKLGGLGAGPSTNAVGIFANNRLNTTVRNCNIRGFESGVQISGSGHLVSGNRFEANRLCGICVFGDNNAIRDNWVIDTGNSGIVSGVIAIYTTGTVDISDNTISGVVSLSSARGMLLGDASYSTVRRNVVRGVIRGANGVQTGADIAGVTESVDIRDNSFFGVSDGRGEGVYCADATVATVKDNVFLSHDIAYFNCNDGGGNVDN